MVTPHKTNDRVYQNYECATSCILVIRQFQVSQSAKNPGAESTGDYSESLVKYFNIDRAAGKLVINGIDYRAEVDELL